MIDKKTRVEIRCSDEIRIRLKSVCAKEKLDYAGALNVLLDAYEEVNNER